MDYLYALSLGEKGTRTEKDKCYFGILNNPNKYVSDGTLEEVGEDLEEMNEQTEIDIAEQETEDISLSDNQVDSLLSFIGYGNLSEANIAFFGNEGGLGGKTPKENIDFLTNLYKNILISIWMASGKMVIGTLKNGIRRKVKNPYLIAHFFI